MSEHEFIITKIHHTDNGPQQRPVIAASMRCYRIQRAEISDENAAFEAFDAPTRNFGSELLPVGTKLKVQIIRPDGT